MVRPKSPSGIVTRRGLEVASSRLAETPVLALHGPRTVGKSTLLRQLAGAHGVDIIDLDDLALRDAVNADPATFVTGPSLICIDEYQRAPTVLDAIKAELNKNLRPGRFVLTGSTRYDTLPQAAQSLTGRLHVLQLWPFSQGEIEGSRENLLEALLSEHSAVVDSAVSKTSRADYIARITAGGFPMAVGLQNQAARTRWFDDYVNLVLERDVLGVGKIRQREQLPRLLRRLAGQTAQILNVSAAASDLGFDRTTASDYLRLLEAVFLVFQLPAWGRTLRARAAATPKLHVLDSGVAARLLRLTPEKLARLDATSLTEFGHLLETFAIGELLKQVSWLDGIAGWGHWRTHDGDEVDLIVERDDGGIVAFEVKASGRVLGDQMRSLDRIRRAAGEAFIAGVALYTGNRSYKFDDRLYVLPLDRVWSPIT